MQKDKQVENLIKLYGEDNVFLIAVYGSLRQPFGNHGLITPEKGLATFLGEFKTPPEYTMYSLGGFPGLHTGGETAITMEVYATHKKSVLDRVDMLEGYRSDEFADPTHPRSNFYNRVEIETPWGIAYTYLYNGSPSAERIVVTGDWVNREPKPETNEKATDKVSTTDTK